mgnify:CR=1 FL=1
MAEIYLVRHGKTRLNDKQIIIGHLNPSLMKSSLLETKRLALKLKDLDFDVIFSSDLKRAVQTSKIILKYLNYKPKLVLIPELREINYGKLSGKSKKKILLDYPLYHKDINFLNPEGESFKQLYKRSTSFLKKIAPKYDKILFVTHSGCIRALYSYCNNKNLKDNLNLTLGHDKIVKCIVTKKRKSAVFI